jgi:hypothetical protein
VLCLQTRLKEVFALFDNDGDGMLTEAEFKELLSTMGAGSFDVPSAPVDFAALKQLFTDHRFQPQQVFVILLGIRLWLVDPGPCAYARNVLSLFATH